VSNYRKWAHSTTWWQSIGCDYIRDQFTKKIYFLKRTKFGFVIWQICNKTRLYNNCVIFGRIVWHFSGSRTYFAIHQFRLWSNPPLTPRLKVYIFNVTNPDEILAGAMPRVSEVGPYVYSAYQVISPMIYN